MEYPQLTPGILLRRYKRFLADIELDTGEVVVAHCPNTGSMRSVNVPGCRVWLAPSTNPARKLAWTWELIELAPAGGASSGADTLLASVNTARANAIVEEALHAGRIEELAGYAALKREVAVDGARLDFRLDDPQRGSAYVEVKQVTLKETDGHGYFPASVSVRGTRHLETLARLAAGGQRAVLLFCVANTGIRDVAPAAHIDSIYTEAIRRVARQGVEVLAYACEMSFGDGRPQAIRLGRRLPVSLRREMNVADRID